MSRRPQPSDFGRSELSGNVDSITHRQRVRVSRIRHGIGGGMRLSEDAYSTRSAGSFFSAEYMGRRLSLTPRRVCLGLYCMFIVCLLALAHIQLQFQTRDLKMQQHLLQTSQVRLQKQHHVLERQMVQYRDIQHLKDIAQTNLQMVEINNPHEMKVTASVRAKYTAPAGQMGENGTVIETAQSPDTERINPFQRLKNIALAWANR